MRLKPNTLFYYIALRLGQHVWVGFMKYFFPIWRFFSLFKHIVLLIFQDVMPIKGLRRVQVRVQLKYTYVLRKYRFVNISKTFKSCLSDFFLPYPMILSSVDLVFTYVKQKWTFSQVKTYNRTISTFVK